MIDIHCFADKMQSCWYKETSQDIQRYRTYLLRMLENETRHKELENATQYSERVDSTMLDVGENLNDHTAEEMFRKLLGDQDPPVDSRNWAPTTNVGTSVDETCCLSNTGTTPESVTTTFSDLSPKRGLAETESLDASKRQSSITSITITRTSGNHKEITAASVLPLLATSTASMPSQVTDFGISIENGNSTSSAATSASTPKNEESSSTVTLSSQYQPRESANTFNDFQDPSVSVQASVPVSNEIHPKEVTVPQSICVPEIVTSVDVSRNMSTETPTSPDTSANTRLSMSISSYSPESQKADNSPNASAGSPAHFKDDTIPSKASVNVTPVFNRVTVTTPSTEAWEAAFAENEQTVVREPSIQSQEAMNSCTIETTTALPFESLQKALPISNLRTSTTSLESSPEIDTQLLAATSSYFSDTNAGVKELDTVAFARNVTNQETDNARTDRSSLNPDTRTHMVQATSTTSSIFTQEPPVDSSKDSSAEISNAPEDFATENFAESATDLMSARVPSTVPCTSSCAEVYVKGSPKSQEPKENDSSSSNMGSHNAKSVTFLDNTSTDTTSNTSPLQLPVSEGPTDFLGRAESTATATNTELADVTTLNSHQTSISRSTQSCTNLLSSNSFDTSIQTPDFPLSSTDSATGLSGTVCHQQSTQTDKTMQNNTSIYADTLASERSADTQNDITVSLLVSSPGISAHGDDVTGGLEDSNNLSVTEALPETPLDSPRVSTTSHATSVGTLRDTKGEVFDLQSQKVHDDASVSTVVSITGEQIYPSTTGDTRLPIPLRVVTNEESSGPNQKSLSSDGAYVSHSNICPSTLELLSDVTHISGSREHCDSLSSNGASSEEHNKCLETSDFPQNFPDIGNTTSANTPARKSEESSSGTLFRRPEKRLNTKSPPNDSEIPTTLSPESNSTSSISKNSLTPSSNSLTEYPAPSPRELPPCASDKGSTESLVVCSISVPVAATSTKTVTSTLANISSDCELLLVQQQTDVLSVITENSSEEQLAVCANEHKDTNREHTKTFTIRPGTAITVYIADKPPIFRRIIDPPDRLEPHVNSKRGSPPSNIEGIDEDIALTRSFENVELCHGLVESMLDQEDCIDFRQTLWKLLVTGYPAQITLYSQEGGRDVPDKVIEGCCQQIFSAKELIVLSYVYNCPRDLLTVAEYSPKDVREFADVRGGFILAGILHLLPQLMIDCHGKLSSRNAIRHILALTMLRTKHALNYSQQESFAKVRSDYPVLISDSCECSTDEELNDFESDLIRNLEGFITDNIRDQFPLGLLAIMFDSIKSARSTVLKNAWKLLDKLALKFRECMILDLCKDSPSGTWLNRTRIISSWVHIENEDLHALEISSGRDTLHCFWKIVHSTIKLRSQNRLTNRELFEILHSYCRMILWWYSQSREPNYPIMEMVVMVLYALISTSETFPYPMSVDDADALVSPFGLAGGGIDRLYVVNRGFFHSDFHLLANNLEICVVADHSTKNLTTRMNHCTFQKMSNVIEHVQYQLNITLLEVLFRTLPKEVNQSTSSLNDAYDDDLLLKPSYVLSNVSSYQSMVKCAERKNRTSGVINTSILRDALRFFWRLQSTSQHKEESIATFNTLARWADQVPVYSPLTKRLVTELLCETINNVYDQVHAESVLRILLGTNHSNNKAGRTTVKSKRSPKEAKSRKVRETRSDDFPDHSVALSTCLTFVNERQDPHGLKNIGTSLNKLSDNNYNDLRKKILDRVKPAAMKLDGLRNKVEMVVSFVSMLTETASLVAHGNYSAAMDLMLTDNNIKAVAYWVDCMPDFIACSKDNFGDFLDFVETISNVMSLSRNGSQLRSFLHLRRLYEALVHRCNSDRLFQSLASPSTPTVNCSWSKSAFVVLSRYASLLQITRRKLEVLAVYHRLQSSLHGSDVSDIGESLAQGAFVKYGKLATPSLQQRCCKILLDRTSECLGEEVNSLSSEKVLRVLGTSWKGWSLQIVNLFPPHVHVSLKQLYTVIVQNKDVPNAMEETSMDSNGIQSLIDKAFQVYSLFKEIEDDIKCSIGRGSAREIIASVELAFASGMTNKWIWVRRAEELINEYFSKKRREIMENESLLKLPAVHYGGGCATSVVALREMMVDRLKMFKTECNNAMMRTPSHMQSKQDVLPQIFSVEYSRSPFCIWRAACFASEEWKTLLSNDAENDADCFRTIRNNINLLYFDAGRFADLQNQIFVFVKAIASLFKSNTNRSEVEWEELLRWTQDLPKLPDDKIDALYIFTICQVSLCTEPPNLWKVVLYLLVYLVSPSSSIDTYVEFWLHHVHVPSLLTQLYLTTITPWTPTWENLKTILTESRQHVANYDHECKNKSSFDSEKGSPNGNLLKENYTQWSSKYLQVSGGLSPLSKWRRARSILHGEK